MGRVHVGFVKALGLQEEEDCHHHPARAPSPGTCLIRTTPPTPAAGSSYKLREVLRPHLKKHPKVQAVVTGHSLGGALAAIFPALLAFHGETDILQRLRAVHTYGQPRVVGAGAAPPGGVPVRRGAAGAVRSTCRCWRGSGTHGGACAYYDGEVPGAQVRQRGGGPGEGRVPVDEGGARPPRGRVAHKEASD
ncbi:hypothetical protein BAE44_0003112 [Dichanthelium oligosanthes]|uniref:Fungal lipase-type domain-containing protein n=1 Tax=Dichanthelium oligosanthes TaxID=888268 RepID=A0A1E5WEQ0_9POAL|nr:hypothetical protein BAE44_0003112 [Dichanthelium oligosanthes]